MDPQACFQRYVSGIESGDYDATYDAAEDYRRWLAMGGFKAKDKDGSEVLKLDPEQDRYLVNLDGIEVWRYPPT